MQTADVVIAMFYLISAVFALITYGEYRTDKASKDSAQSTHQK